MKVTSPKKKPFAVRLGKGVFMNIILHQAETKQQAEAWKSKHENVHQRDPVVKILGLHIINLLEKQ